VNVIAPEYPGYGIYSGIPNEKVIYEDSLIVYDYLVDQLKIPKSNLLIFGRSIGSGPSVYLAGQREATCLILISPMMSIKTIFKDYLGKLVAYFINDKFENYKRIEEISCPILIIHGQSDTLIKYYHATELYNRAKAPCELVLPEQMDHNEFDFYQEFSEPLLDFISRNAIFAYTQAFDINLPNEIFKTPESFKNPVKPWNFLTKILKKFSVN
jgi:fermentation-respiration switch protein FrsA (DUF1100 family)